MQLHERFAYWVQTHGKRLAFKGGVSCLFFATGFYLHYSPYKVIALGPYLAVLLMLIPEFWSIAASGKCSDSEKPLLNLTKQNWKKAKISFIFLVASWLLSVYISIIGPRQWLLLSTLSMLAFSRVWLIFLGTMLVDE